MSKSISLVVFILSLTGCELYSYQALPNLDDLASTDSASPAAPDLLVGMPKPRQDLSLLSPNESNDTSLPSCQLISWSSNEKWRVVTKNLIPDSLGYKDCSITYTFNFAEKNIPNNYSHMKINLNYRSKLYVSYDLPNAKIGLYSDVIEVGIISGNAKHPIISIGGFVPSDNASRNVELTQNLDIRNQGIPTGIYVKFNSNIRKTPNFNKTEFDELLNDNRLSFIQFNAIQLLDHP